MKNLFYVLLILRIVQMHFASWNKDERYTRIITLKQGNIQGRILKPKRNPNLSSVEAYLGVPYAAPPVANLRFMPPGAPLQWTETLGAFHMKPVCPQMLPNLDSAWQKKMSSERNIFIRRMKQYLKNENEDCLYLNIYVPHTLNKGPENRKYPVILFIHGESFEWNSGNLYDGTIMASYGNVIFITINFRLGIFGFLKHGLMVGRANFGLSDQIAALQWTKHNIAEFGGDPLRITVMGHGTGAACVNFLMLSPVAEGLFHRAILMGGSALSEWALTAIPLHYIQLKDEFNCSSDNIINCLQRKRKEDIMSAFKKHELYPFENFTPVIDEIVVLNSPAEQMEKYSLFSKYDLLAGVNEVESYYFLEEEFQKRGMLLSEGSHYFNKYTKTIFKKAPETALLKIVERYFAHLKDRSPFTIRDAVLDALSDLLITAPLLQTIRYHAPTPKNTFLYVFGHRTASERYVRVNRSVYGDDLPYALGIPLDPPSYHYISEYTPEEEQLSEMMLKYFANFAKTGNPNLSQNVEFAPNLHVNVPRPYSLRWPPYSLDKQLYWYFGIPSLVRHHYRSEYDQFWNQPSLNSLKNYNEETIPEKEEENKNLDPIENDENHNAPVYDVPLNGPADVNEMTGFGNRPAGLGMGMRNSWPPQPSSPIFQGEESNGMYNITGENGASIIQTSAFTATALIIVATVFLLVNVGAFAFIFYQRGKLRVRENLFRNRFRCTTVSVPDIFEENENGDIYAIAECHRKEETKKTRSGKSRTRFKRATAAIASKTANKRRLTAKKDLRDSDGARVASVKPEAISGKRMRRWPLMRQCSGSTITVVDAQSKVRDWIAQGIVNRSPRFLRDNKKNKSEKANVGDVIDNVEQVMSYRRVGCEKSIVPPTKISIGVDATPAARTGSVLKQVPIELTKSLDDGKNPLSSTSIRSATSMSSIHKKGCVADGRSNVFGGDSSCGVGSGSDDVDEHLQKTGTHKSSARIRLKTPQIPIDVLPVSHFHSRSDPSASAAICENDYPLQPLYRTVNKKANRLKNFASSSKASDSFELGIPHYEEINMTSLNDSVDSNYTANYHPTTEHTLSSLAKRFPKVLPDISDSGRKFNRLSLPTTCALELTDCDGESYLDTFTYKSAPKLGRVPPVPPPRLTSTLGRGKPMSNDDENTQFSHITIQLRKVEPVITEEKCVDILQTESCDT